MNVSKDVLEKLKDYVSMVEDYVSGMYGDDVESLLDDIRDLDYETEKLKSWIEDLEADIEEGGGHHDSRI